MARNQIDELKRENLCLRDVVERLRGEKAYLMNLSQYRSQEELEQAMAIQTGGKQDGK